MDLNNRIERLLAHQLPRILPAHPVNPDLNNRIERRMVGGGLGWERYACWDLNNRIERVNKLLEEAENALSQADLNNRIERGMASEGRAREKGGI